MIPFSFDDSEVAPLQRVFSRLLDTLGSLANAVTNAHLIRVPIATGDTFIRHGLGAPVNTWEVVDRNANAVIWQSATVNPRPRDQIILKASAPVTVLLRFT